MNFYSPHENISFCDLEKYFLVSLSTKGAHPYNDYSLSAGRADSISCCITKQNLWALSINHCGLQGHVRTAKPLIGKNWCGKQNRRCYLRSCKKVPD